MTLEEFLFRLKGVKGSGNQYSALCPAHDDHDQSLSVCRREDGGAVVNCHAGCSKEAITAALGLTVSDLYNSPKPDRVQSPMRLGKAVAWYDYTDIDGRFLNQKTRWVKADGKKTFTWRHKDSHGNWVKGHQGKPVLYNLPVLKEAPVILVVEGEKDVETLKAHKIPAVCGAHGAGKDKWLPQYTEALKGKAVVVIQDNDDVGKQFAIETCNALYGTAKSIKLVDLAKVWQELPEHGDITDLMEHMGEDGLTAVIKLAKDDKEYQPQEAGPSLPSFFDGRKFLHHVMGDYLIKKFGVCKINDSVHIYDNGIYRQGEEILHGHMVSLIPDLTDAKRKEVYKYIKVNLKTPVKKVSPPHLIPFATKIYDLKNDRFLDYGPEYVFLNRFPYDYKPDAPVCETVTGVISRIAGGDQEIIELLYEAMGNCFYLLNSYRGAVMLYGPNGNNGKSTLLNLISQLVGAENASFLSLQDTAERFKLIGLYGKAVNIGDDISSNYIPDTERFKMLVTGGTVSAEHKGQDPIHFKPYAKLFFALNGLPPVSDKSKAYFSRVLLIPLSQDFSKNKDVSLKDKQWSQAEMEYLTCLAMDGLKRLICQGDFTRPECVVEALADYEAENNPISGFLEEYGRIEGQPTELVYFDFCRWCEKNGHKNVPTRTRFAREVIQQTGMVSVSIRHEYFGGNTGRCFANP